MYMENSRQYFFHVLCKCTMCCICLAPAVLPQVNPQSPHHPRTSNGRSSEHKDFIWNKHMSLFLEVPLVTYKLLIFKI